MAIRILYLWQAGYPWEVRVDKFCRSLQRRGCSLTILARWKPGQSYREEYQGAQIVRVGYRRPASWSVPVSCNPVWFSTIRHYVQREKPHLVIAREILLAEAAALACQSPRIPVIIDMAEHYPATMRTFKKYRRNPFLRFLVFRARVPDIVERRSVCRADGIITVCEEQVERLHRSFGYPREKTAIVQNTPELNQFAGVKKGATTPPRVFGYHGTMTPQRGLDKLLAGWELAAAKLPDIELLLAGGGESYEDVASAASRSPFKNRIHLTGRYRPEQLPALYSRTDVGLVPQPPDESCDHTIPNKLYDYFACGKPVIVSPARPLRRLVEEYAAGIAADACTPEAFAQAIAEMRNRDVGAMARHGLAAAHERLNWEKDEAELWRFVSRYIG